ncbi:MAG TPA: Tol-Pal system beta propeller repeat protein TolB [Anaeromyxobacter sp.]|nr:Tol-Pal system beta propeller repeat protein TolB [Anaeromyxobacter sp.]
MTRAILALAAAASFSAPAFGQDRPTLVIGSPNFQPFPIAVADFQGDAEVRGKDVSDVVRSDLALSGLFDVLDPRGFLAEAAEGYAAPSIRFTRWADVGADGLAKARVRRSGNDLEGELHLYEVRAAREVLAATVRAPAADPRAIGHKIADEIVKYYTHEPGVFGTKLVAIRKARGVFELVLFDADGKNPRALLSERSILLTPAWRPDGKEILVTSYRSGRPEIWAYRLADRTFRRLSQVPNAMGGVYSPDGTRIAFTASDAGNADVWVMNADGSGARRLTKDPALDLSPAWSPDGKRIAFVSDRAGTPQIYLMSAEGSDPRRLTFQGNYNQTPQWSPRGDLIAFTARDERKVFDVFVIAADSGRVARITQDQGRTNEEPSWAPNGRLLVFKTDRGGASQLVVSDPRGERQTVIAAGVGELSAPAWGPLTE